ncbi:MAG TPA: hypothetical protein PJ991_10405 [Kiritimatiellia bacterium]|nr:hypothetical protein [Kiritimatiellia bacterium]
MKSIKIDIPVYLLVLLFTATSAFGSGRVIAWGIDGKVPAINGEVQRVSAGFMHSLALSTSGVVFAWGDNSSGQLNIPNAAMSHTVAISAGGFHSLALNKDGKVTAWGMNQNGQCTIPNRVKDVAAISAGLMHSMALLNNGLVVSWGDNQFWQSGVPAGLTKVTAISAGAFHSMALRQSGDIVIWGDNSFGQAAIPASAQNNIRAISAGYYHSMALTQNGRVIAWGDNSYGQCNIPADALEDVVAISAGQMHSMAIKSDGRLITWGGAPVFQPSPSKSASAPSFLGVSAGGYHSLGIIPSTLDTNGDGIPDWWAIQHGLDPYGSDGSTTDSDGDGFTDLEEYLAGTDPVDADSFFYINMSFDTSTRSTRMDFGPISGERQYVIEYAQDITKNLWRPVPTKEGITVEDVQGNTSVTFNPNQENRIYRVKILSP